MYILQLSLICLCDIDLPTSSTNWCSHFIMASQAIQLGVSLTAQMVQLLTIKHEIRKIHAIRSFIKSWLPSTCT